MHSTVGSNALVESTTNTKLRLLTRMVYGFKFTDNLIALCLLDRGGSARRYQAARPPDDTRKRAESRLNAGRFDVYWSGLQSTIRHPQARFCPDRTGSAEK